MLQLFRLAQFATLGYFNFGSRSFISHKRDFNPTALAVDLTGKHYIITGATSGLGLEVAHQLATRHATVHLVCRNRNKGGDVKKQITAATENSNVHVHICDISSLKQMYEFSCKWKESKIPIAALINNAGVLVNKRLTSEDGFELSFATNTLGTFVLTEMLVSVLTKSPSARVITVSSGGMLPAFLTSRDFDGKSLYTKDGIEGSKQYGRCKRRQVALTEYWAEKHQTSGIFWATMHPGWADTPGVKTSIPEFYNAMKSRLRTAEQGADTIVYLAAAEEARSFKSGEFFFDRKPVAKHLCLSGTEYNKSATAKLVEKLRAIVKEKGYLLPE